MESVLQTIKQNELIKSGEVIGVALSGGKDSMVMMDYLASLQEELDFEVVGITVDHSIRETSGDDARFVISWCREHSIRAYKFKVDAVKLAEEKNISLETAAREARYGVFKAVLDKGIIDKIAIAHHMQDQAETVLIRLFRGTGIAGAKGMEIERDDVFIRPMLNTSRKEIDDYANYNDIPFVQDETNFDDSYARNFLRNKILPLIVSKWPGAVGAINSFAKACSDDDEYISTQVFDDALIVNGKTVRIPISYFCYPNAITSRLILRALKQIGAVQDIERRHIELVRNLALNGENGSKLSLPFEITAIKEYDYLSLVNQFVAKPIGSWPMKSMALKIDNFGELIIKKTKTFNSAEGTLILDAKKLPKTAIWRFRQEGDTFTKYGGGSKKLKAYLISKKVPQRLRDFIPVLADGNNILAIAGVEIADSVKIDGTTTSAYSIAVKKQ